MALKIPSTNPHKLTAERIARVTKAIMRKLVEKGIIPPPTSSEPPRPKTTDREPDSEHDPREGAP